MSPPAIDADKFTAELPGELPDNLHLLSNIYLVENRLYQVMVVFQGKFDRRAEFERVASSFKLKPAAAPAKKKGSRPAAVAKDVP